MAFEEHPHLASQELPLEASYVMSSRACDPQTGHEGGVWFRVY